MVPVGGLTQRGLCHQLPNPRQHPRVARRVLQQFHELPRAFEVVVSFSRPSRQRLGMLVELRLAKTREKQRRIEQDQGLEASRTTRVVGHDRRQGKQGDQAGQGMKDADFRLRLEGRVDSLDDAAFVADESRNVVAAPGT